MKIGIETPWMVRTLIAMVVVVDSEATKKKKIRIEMPWTVKT